jgi:hypothetical protein
MHALSSFPTSTVIVTENGFGFCSRLLFLELQRYQRIILLAKMELDYFSFTLKWSKVGKLPTIYCFGF